WVANGKRFSHLPNLNRAECKQRHPTTRPDTLPPWGGVMLLGHPPLLGFSVANPDRATLQRVAQEKERKRIAQELHDTLLQGFTGVALSLAAVTNTLPPALSKTKEQLQKLLEQIDDYLAEARRSIWKLRSTTLESTENFSRALRRAGERALAGAAIPLSF